MTKLEKELVRALKALANPNNFRTDPTPRTLAARDAALLRAAKVLARVKPD